MFSLLFFLRLITLSIFYWAVFPGLLGLSESLGATKDNACHPIF